MFPQREAATVTEIYFATNRNIESEAPLRLGNRFNAERDFFYRVGKVPVSRRPSPEDPWDGAYAVDMANAALFPETAPGPGLAEVPGSRVAFGEVSGAMQAQSRDVLLFIHGFASSFESAMQRAAELRDQYLAPRLAPLAAKAGSGRTGPAREPLAFAFSWPSDGVSLGAGTAPEPGGVPKWAYFSDRDDAEASAKAIARSFARLIEYLARLTREQACEQRIHLVAHSMGVFTLRHALQALRAILNTARLPRIIDNAFLMAGDEDADALERPDKLQPLVELARQIHVYHASDDRALVVSDTTKFNPDRLGEHGPTALSRSVGRIYAVDCSNVSDTILAHGRHLYYRLVPEVIADVREVLAGVPADRVRGRTVVEGGRRFRIRRNPALRRDWGYPPGEG
jgi:esterase/lipase superfamily enzyme